MAKVRYDGYLDDYAFMIAGLLDLHEVSQEQKWLDAAVDLQAVLDRDFKDSAGGYFLLLRVRTSCWPVTIRTMMARFPRGIL